MSNKNKSSDLLDSLKCPITYELFRDPVIGSDGHTYERENITAWIKKHATSPITREPMTLSSLRPNYIVKKMVEEFVSLSVEKQYQFRLDVDVCKTKPRPIFQSPGKTIYEGKWMLKHGPPIILIKIDGTKANREASFYVKLSCHPHIVRTYGLVECNSRDSIMLVQEYAPEGDLSQLFRDNNFQPTIEVLIEIFRQIVDAMICLADNQIIHGDLACRNVLVFRSNPNQPTDMLVKLTDFGLTRSGSLFSVTESSASSTMKLIPVRSAAPEILLNTSARNYSEKSDVYSFGVLMWEACSEGSVPYGDLRTTDVVYAERLKGKLLERPKKCSDELWQLILNCTQQLVDKRPNFKTIQEDLLSLRFQNRRESTIRASQIESAYINTTDRTLSANSVSARNHSLYYNQQSLTTTPVYHNLNTLTNESQFSDSFDSKSTLCQYYTPCAYCSESINSEDFEAHKNTCKIQQLVKSFAKYVVKLPLIEITSCQYCENMIPLNMLRVHQNTCNKDSNCLQNRHPISPQSPLPDSYVTFNYLKPLSMVKPDIKETDDAYAVMSSVRIEKPILNSTMEPQIAAQPSIQQESIPIKGPKASKTGIRKYFSKMRKKKSS